MTDQSYGAPDVAYPGSPDTATGPNAGDTDLSDLLQEMRVLLQGAQVLSAFLIVVPFNTGFANVNHAERWIYVVTFLCAITSLVLLSAPAAQHRLERPLVDRERFKRTATRAIVWGVGALSFALVLATLLVVSEVLGLATGAVVAGVTSLLIAWSWWILPVLRKRRQRRHPLVTPTST